MLAVWAARREVVTPRIVADFLAAKKFGLAHIADIAEGASLKLELPARSLEHYLRENIDFSSRRAKISQAWSLYFKLCAEAGLIPRARPIEFAA